MIFEYSKDKLFFFHWQTTSSQVEEEYLWHLHNIVEKGRFSDLPSVDYLFKELSYVMN